jgi:hypothetical protein
MTDGPIEIPDGPKPKAAPGPAATLIPVVVVEAAVSGSKLNVSARDTMMKGVLGATPAEIDGLTKGAQAIKTNEDRGGDDAPVQSYATALDRKVRPAIEVEAEMQAKAAAEAAAAAEVAAAEVAAAEAAAAAADTGVGALFRRPAPVAAAEPAPAVLTPGDIPAGDPPVPIGRAGDPEDEEPEPPAAEVAAAAEAPAAAPVVQVQRILFETADGLIAADVFEVQEFAGVADTGISGVVVVQAEGSAGFIPRRLADLKIKSLETGKTYPVKFTGIVFSCGGARLSIYLLTGPVESPEEVSV